MAAKAEQPNEKQELWVFFFFTVVLEPLLAVTLVGGYGFAIWICQLFAGPPGPPGGCAQWRISANRGADGCLGFQGIVCQSCRDTCDDRAINFQSHPNGQLFRLSISKVAPAAGLACRCAR